MTIETDEGFAELVGDNDRLLAMVKEARVEFTDEPELGIWSAADALTFITALGFDVSASWLGQQMRRGHLALSRIGGVVVMRDAQVAGAIGKLWDQRRFLTGRFLWAKSEAEVESDGRELDHFVEVCRYLSETHDSEELDRRYREAIAEASREASSDKPDAEERVRESLRTADRYRCAWLMRQGAFDKMSDPDASNGLGVENVNAA